MSISMDGMTRIFLSSEINNFTSINVGLNNPFHHQRVLNFQSFLLYFVESWWFSGRTLLLSTKVGIKLPPVLEVLFSTMAPFHTSVCSSADNKRQIVLSDLEFM